MSRRLAQGVEILLLLLPNIPSPWEIKLQEGIERANNQLEQEPAQGDLSRLSYKLLCLLVGTNSFDRLGWDESLRFLAHSNHIQRFRQRIPDNLSATKNQVYRIPRCRQG